MSRFLSLAFAALTFILLPTAFAADPPALVGSYAVSGQFDGGESYAGTLVIERLEGGALQGRYALREADGDPVDRPPTTVHTVRGFLRLGWSEDDQGSQTVYDLATLSGTLSRARKILAHEHLERRTRLVIVHTNDSHGQLIPFLDPATRRQIGGFAARATIVARIRREADRIGATVLVLDAGDVNTGLPESDLLDATPDLEAMNAIGYDAMAIGNHEFDPGLDVLSKQRALATFPFLSANVIEERTGQPLFEAHAIFERQDVLIAVFGLTTESAEFITLPENRAGLRFEPALDAGARQADLLRPRADVLIALTHLGYYEDGEYGTSTPGEVSLARSVPGLDVIVGGHTHTPLEQPVIEQGALIVQAHDRGRVVGRLDLLLDAEKQIDSHEYRLIPVVVSDPAQPDSAAIVAEDPQIKELIAPHLARVTGQLDELLAESQVILDGERPHVRAGDTNLGFLVTDAYRSVAKTDVAFAIGGGIRSSVAAGQIRYRDALTVLPFGNRLVRGQLTGQGLLDVAAIAARQLPPAGGWLQVSGITWTLDAGEAKDVKVQGEPVDPTKLYSVVVDRFLAEGGESYTPFKTLAERENLPLVDAEALKAYLVEHGVPDYAAEKRVTVLSAPAPVPAREPVGAGAGH